MLESTELKAIETDTAEKQKESLEIEELIGSLEIKSHSDLKEAVSFIAEIKKQHNEIEAKRKTVSKPLTQAAKELNAFFKAPVDPLVRAESALKQKIGQYTFDCHMQRSECLDKITDSTTLPDKQKLIKDAEEYIVPKIPGMSVSDFWGGDVDDVEAVKKWAIENNRTELLLVNGKVLEELTKATGKDPKIPGWRAERKVKVAITVSKVK